MINDVYTQYATRLGSGLSILMHSIIYDAPNPYTVWASSTFMISAGVLYFVSSSI